MLWPNDSPLQYWLPTASILHLRNGLMWYRHFRLESALLPLVSRRRPYEGVLTLLGLVVSTGQVSKPSCENSSSTYIDLDSNSVDNQAKPKAYSK